MSLGRRRASWHDQEHLTAILDGLPVNAIACDQDLTIVYISPHAERTMAALREPVRQRFGVDVDQLLGMNIHRFHADPANTERILYASGGDLHHSARFELGGLTLESVITAATSRSGAILGYLAVINDVTDQAAAASAIRETTAGLAGSSENLSHATERLDAATADVTRRADAVSAGMDRFLELGRGVAEGADLIRGSTLRVVDAAHAATGTVTELDAASARIGEFTKLITSIAEQTNLLALNATIEATRAGAAGAGFAVVAREVKDLAQRSKSATDQVGAVIDAIQATSAAVGAALDSITTGIDTVGEQQLAVNVIVDQQVQQVQHMVDLTSGMVTDMTQLAEAVGMTRAVTTRLGERAETLRGLAAP